jgi:hypothetical protein
MDADAIQETLQNPDGLIRIGEWLKDNLWSLTGIGVVFIFFVTYMGFKYVLPAWVARKKRNSS